MSISDDAVQRSATGSETEVAATTLPAESILLSSWSWEQSAATSCSETKGANTDEIPNVPQSRTRMAGEVSEYYRRQGLQALHHQERLLQEAAARHKGEAERLLQVETARVATQTSLPNEFSFFTDLRTTSQLCSTNDNEFHEFSRSSRRNS